MITAACVESCILLLLKKHTNPDRFSPPPLSVFLLFPTSIHLSVGYCQTDCNFGLDFNLNFDPVSLDRIQILDGPLSFIDSLHTRPDSKHRIHIVDDTRPQE